MSYKQPKRVQKNPKDPLIRVTFTLNKSTYAGLNFIHGRSGVNRSKFVRAVLSEYVKSACEVLDDKTLLNIGLPELAQRIGLHEST